MPRAASKFINAAFLERALSLMRVNSVPGKSFCIKRASRLPLSSSECSVQIVISLVIKWSELSHLQSCLQRRTHIWGLFICVSRISLLLYPCPFHFISNSYLRVKNYSIWLKNTNTKTLLSKLTNSDARTFIFCVFWSRSNTGLALGSMPSISANADEKNTKRILKTMMRKHSFLIEA